MTSRVEDSADSLPDHHLFPRGVVVLDIVEKKAHLVTGLRQQLRPFLDQGRDAPQSLPISLGPAATAVASTWGWVSSTNSSKGRARMYSPFIQLSFSGSKTAGFLETSIQVERGDRLIPREDRRLGIERPAEQGQVVEDGIREVAVVPIHRQVKWPRIASTVSCRRSRRAVGRWA